MNTRNYIAILGCVAAITLTSVSDASAAWGNFGEKFGSGGRTAAEKAKNCAQDYYKGARGRSTQTTCGRQGKETRIFLETLKKGWAR